MKRMLAIALVLAFCLPTTALAQSSLDDFLPIQIPGLRDGSSMALGDFEAQFAAYLWTVGLEGTVGVRGSTTYVDISFADIFKMLNIGAMAFGEVRKGEWALLTDFLYASLSDSANPLPNLSIDSDIKMIAGDAVIGYRMGNYPVTVDLLAGVRYFSISMDLDLSSPLPVPLLNRTISGSQQWADPVIGSRVMFKLNEKLGFRTRIDVGGFGASSEQLVQIITGFDYKVNDNLTMALGYRNLSYRHFDVDKGFTFDAGLHGFALAIGFKF